jgi:ribonuclease BN (tRNA processing enzyme)
VGWGHSAWEEVADFARRSGVKRLFLTHHDPDSDDGYLSELNEQIQCEYASEFHTVQLAREDTRIYL